MKIRCFDPPLGGVFMATNPLRKRNSIMGGLNHPPTEWDDPHPHNKLSGPPDIGYLYMLK